MTTRKRRAVKARLTLDKSLDHAAAPCLKERIAASRGSSLTVSAADVEHLGAQCVQVLMAASKTWRNEGLDFDLVDRSAAFDTAVRLLGLDSEFQQ